MEKVKIYAGRVRALADWLDDGGRRECKTLPVEEVVTDIDRYILPLDCLERNGDPYPQEWLACHGEAVLACSPNVVKELDGQHTEFVKSLARWRNRPDGSAARSFAAWLEELAATGGSPMSDTERRRRDGSRKGGKVAAANRKAAETQKAGVDPDSVLQEAADMVRNGAKVKVAVAYIMEKLEKLELTPGAAEKRLQRCPENKKSKAG